MTRYAIYALPGALAPDPIRTLAEAWIGRTVDGSALQPAVPAGWTRAEVDAVTVDPRRYGFHATLKPPFQLAAGRTAEQLDADVASFAAGAAKAVLPDIGIQRISGFYALTAAAPDPSVHTLADAVVQRFDGFRAPPTPEERARRHPEAMSSRQRHLFERWGYPYVFDEFRAHLTLTDRIPEHSRNRVEAALGAHFAGHLDRDVLIDALCVYQEPAPGAPFTLRSIHPLATGTPRQGAA